MTTFSITHSPQLKIKACSLAAEARIIRNYEKRLKKAAKYHPQCGEQRQSLYLHRTGVVRNETRSTLLAYGFLRGREYKALEQTRYSNPDWKAIERMIGQYGSGRLQDRMQQFEQWKQSAGEIAGRKPRVKRQRPSNRAEAAA